MKVTPLNQFRELQIFWLFSCQISCTGTARTGIQILGSCSAHPLSKMHIVHWFVTWHSRQESHSQRQVCNRRPWLPRPQIRSARTLLQEHLLVCGCSWTLWSWQCRRAPAEGIGRTFFKRNVLGAISGREKSAAGPEQNYNKLDDWMTKDVISEPVGKYAKHGWMK